MTTATVTIVFTDLVRSTETLARLKRDEAEASRGRHIRELSNLVEANTGRVVKTMGDGLMAVFDSPSSAVLFAVAAQQQDADAAPGRGRFPGLRVGIAIGEVSEEEGDYHGEGVVQASRLCQQAKPGQILATRAVRLVAGRVQGADPIDKGPIHLRGLPDPVDVDDLNWLPSSGRPLRVLLADDAILIRQGVARLLEDEGCLVVAQVNDATNLLGLIADLMPDVVVTDVRMPPTFTLEGLEAAVAIRKQFPDVGVLVLSQLLETAYTEDLLGNGASGVGYLLKERVTAVEDFVGAVRRVAAGGTAIDPSMVNVLMGRSRRDGDLASLSSREQQILSLMAEGMSNQGIARHLSLSARTVESHVGSIFTKLGLLPQLDDERRVLAVIRYLRGATGQS